MRTFANPSGITCSPGAIGSTLNGAFTMAAIIRRTSDNDFHALLSLESAGGHRGGLWVTNGGGSGGDLQIVSSGFDTSFGFTIPNSTPVFVAATKAAGDGITPNGWMYRTDTDTWSTAAGAGTINADSDTLTIARIGNSEGADFWYVGDIGIIAVWNYEMTDAQVRQLPFSLQAWYAAAPVAGWLLDQHATTQAVIDWTGGGANQTALSNTSISTASLPTFSYGHPVLVPHSVPAAGGTTFTVDLAGAVAPAGALLRTTGKAVAGTITPAGALARSAGKPLAGSIIPSGALLRRTSKLYAGSTTPSGSLTRSTAKVLAGSVTPTGTLATVRAFLIALAGAITPSGALTRSAGKTAAGSVSPAGAVTRSTGRILAGATTPSGALSRTIGKVLGGSVTPSGALSQVRARLISVAGAITPSGALSRQTGKALTGATAPTGGLTKRLARTLTGGTTPSGTLLKLLGRLLAGSTTPSGTVGIVSGIPARGTMHHAARTGPTAAPGDRTTATASPVRRAGPTMTGGS